MVEPCRSYRKYPSILKLLSDVSCPRFTFDTISVGDIMDSMNDKRLGERIREERLHLRLTQAQLAEDVDISDTYMGAIERGERGLSLDTLVTLAARLGVTVDYLLSDAVPGTGDNITDQFRQIMDGQPLERKRMAIDVLRTMFTHFGQDEK